MKKRGKKYEPKLALKPEVEFDDLIALSLKKEKATVKKNEANRKRAMGKKK